MLLLNSSICVPAVYTMETGMLVSEKFRPVIQIGDVNGVFLNKYWTLSPEEWFLLMKGHNSKLSDWFYETEENPAATVGVDEVDAKKFKDAQNIKVGKEEEKYDRGVEAAAAEGTGSILKKTVSFSADTKPGKDEDYTDIEDTFYLGKYKFTFDERICTASVYKDNELIIRLNEELIHSLYRLYEIISLKLEFLQKYQLYAIYISSRYINHFIKIKDKEFTEDDVDYINLTNIPKITFFKMDYANMDVLVCRTLHAEIRTWALNNIFKTVKTIKSVYSRSWIESNHLYL